MSHFNALALEIALFSVVHVPIDALNIRCLHCSDSEDYVAVLCWNHGVTDEGHSTHDMRHIGSFNSFTDLDIASQLDAPCVQSRARTDSAPGKCPFSGTSAFPKRHSTESRKTTRISVSFGTL
jgi:hypothetical protein